MTEQDTGVLYLFESVWVLDAPIEEAFAILMDPGDTAGTRHVESVVVDPGQPDGLARRSEYRIRSPLLYTMELTAEAVEVEPPHLLRSVVNGDLTGTGVYHLTADHGTTRVRFDWRVRTTKRWMNFLAPFGRPIFVWAHNKVMDELIRAMAVALDVNLISSDSRLVGTGD